MNVFVLVDFYEEREREKVGLRYSKIARQRKE